MTKLTLDRERVTPAAAAEYLKANTQNRKLGDSRVDVLAGAIKRGEWVENAETVKFDVSGALVDGQHRLAAIVRAKKAVPLWIARNCPTEAQDTVDTGRSRSAADVLSIRSYGNANALAATARLMLEYERTKVLGRTSGDRRAPTVQQIVRYVEAEETLADFVKFGKWFAEQDRSLGIPNSVVAASALIFSRADNVTIEDVLDYFSTVLNPKSASEPGAKIRQRLQKGNTATQKMPREVKSALLIKGWNAYITGQRPTHFKFQPGGARPDQFPEVLGAAE